jgi:bacillopeptidase F
MKLVIHFLLACGSIILPSYVDAGRPDPLMARRIAAGGYEAGELVEWGLVLRQQINTDALRREMQLYRYTAQERAQRVIRDALSLQASTQPNLIARLSEQIPTLQIIHSFWVSNMLLIRADASALEILLNEAEIDIIFDPADYPTRAVEPVEASPELMFGEESPEGPGGREPGLDVIGAPALWAMGYTGKGRKAFTVDTGTWTEHPALAHRFVGHFRPLSEGWFSLESRQPVDRPSHHGTHVNGTILGLDTATHDTLGVAFGGYFMASNPLTHSNLTPLHINLLSFQWALNPDGDTSTVDDIPDVINNSWGQAGAADTSFCQNWSTQIFNMVEAAGIAITFSAGNDGPGAATLKHPQFVNTNPINIFSIGAVNGNSSGFPIADFSSRGVSLCGGSGSLLIKPEVVAPGVNVRSAYGKTGYGLLSGTSMSCPHVSGAVLLLKEAFPQLGGDSILWALYHSATDMGSPGEDNTFGNGLISLPAAFNYLATHHSPVPAGGGPIDLSLTPLSVPAPNGPMYCAEQFTNGMDVGVGLLNSGDSVLTNINLTARNGRFHTQNIPINLQLLPGQAHNLTVPLIPIVEGWNELWFTGAPTGPGTDADPVNNHRSARFLVQGLDTLNPLAPNNEAHIAADGWSVDSLVYIQNLTDDDYTWDTAFVGGLTRDAYAFRLRHLQYGGRNRQRDRLTTRSYYTGSGAHSKLSFKRAYLNRNTAFRDSLRVSLVCDCGAVERVLYYSGGDSMRSGMNTMIPDDSLDWKEHNYDLPELRLYPCHIRMETINDFGGNLYIGDMSIQSRLAVSCEEPQELISYRLYPNPSSDGFFLAGPELPKTIHHMRLRDAIGRQHPLPYILEESPNRWYFDTRSLPEGLYFLEIQHPMRATELMRFIRIKP